MKIGILTLPLNPNYGGNLQAYALMTILKRMGHLPMLIDRKNPNARIAQDGPTPRGHPTLDFIARHISPSTKAFFSSKELKDGIGEYGFDAIVVGSDQVWRKKYTPNLLDYFLEFIPENDKKIKRIAYAPSFGTPTWAYDPKFTKRCASLLKRFDVVSVREDVGVQMCREELGVAAEHVLDPTMLLSPTDYAQLFEGKTTDVNRGSGVLIYVLDQDEEKAQIVDAISRRLDLPAFSIKGKAGNNENSAVKVLQDRSMESWLLGFYEADFVITDSFHGTVFSILFNKPFIAYGNPDRGLARFTSLLKMFGLEDRLIQNPSDIDLDRVTRAIDWEKVNARLEMERMKARDFLQSALGANTERVDRNVNVKTGAIKTITLRPGGEDKSGVANPLNVLCTGCGACVSESDGQLRMGWSDDGFLIPYATSKNTDAVLERAIRVCPFNPRPEKPVQDEDALARIFLSEAKNSNPKLGRYENTYVGYSNAFRASSSSGGIATYVFKRLLEQRHVDYLFVVQDDGEGRYKYGKFHKPSEISSISKTRYFPVTMEELFATIERTEGRVAVSGVACFIKAIRLKQHYNPKLREKIPFLVGIVCGGLKSKFFTDFLAQSAGIESSYRKPEYRIKDESSTAIDYSFGAYDENSVFHQMKMRKVGDMWGTGLFKAKACDFCTDVLTELADISVGDAWLPPYKRDGLGNSVIVTRSKLADSIISSGMERGELTVREVPFRQVIQSQASSFTHRQDGVGFRAWWAKRFTNIPVPFIRRRVIKSIPLSYKMVQMQRERTRLCSLEYWRESPHVGIFNERMRTALKELRYLTRLNHKLRAKLRSKK